MNQIFPNNSPFINILLLILAFWTIAWKIYAVWLTVKNNQKKWFAALLILNTMGILEIIYIFYVAKKKWSDVKDVLNQNISEIK